MMTSKYCKICGLPISGCQRKYCPDCKVKVHKEQLHKYYEKNKCRWLCEDGQYNIEKRQCQICGSLAFCEHRKSNHVAELKAIQKEMSRLGLTENNK